MAGVVRADEALIGCNEMLNVFLLAATFGALQVLLYVQMRLWLVAIKCQTCSYWLAFLVHGRWCTCRKSSGWLLSNVKRVSIGWRFKSMTDVIVRADKDLIVCNQMLNVFLLASRNHILHEFLLITNARVVLYVQMKLWLVARKYYTYPIGHLIIWERWLWKMYFGLRYD